MRFTSDGRLVVYAARENGVDNVWMQPMDALRAIRLPISTVDKYRCSTCRRKNLALLHGQDVADVVLLQEAKQRIG